jgi:hypothetical protein
MKIRKIRIYILILFLSVIRSQTIAAEVAAFEIRQSATIHKGCRISYISNKNHMIYVNEVYSEDNTNSVLIYSMSDKSQMTWSKLLDLIKLDDILKEVDNPNNHGAVVGTPAITFVLFYFDGSKKVIQSNQSQKLFDLFAGIDKELWDTAKFSIPTIKNRNDIDVSKTSARDVILQK